MPFSYHDTTNETVRLNEFEEKAKSKEEQVLSFMRANAGKPFTPAEVWKRIDPEGKSPITSIRRAMTNLTKQSNLLVKIETKKPGIYGRDNCTWVLPARVEQGKLF